jgi:UDP-N-acetyl-2-amino-2-deoxyglucuronate dehydrogenase
MKISKEADPMESHVGASNGPSLRFVIIGCAGGIVPTHLQALAHLPTAQIVGMSDIDAVRGAVRAAEVGCSFFTDHRALLADVCPDVAVICTPHPFHAPIALDCFAAGAHVLVEKPMAVEVAEADAMIAAAEAAGRILAVNFQQRFRPAIESIHQLIEAGELGSLLRVLCVEPWFRPAAYYRSASWRGTWAGEGGGVLMNQAPHTLDLLCYLCGLPTKVWGWTRAVVHAIETEDTAQAMLEYADGASGYLNINTVEAALQRRLQIVGDRAAIELAGNQVSIHHFRPALSEYRATSTDLYGSPGAETEVIEAPGDGGGHFAIYRDLQEAILEGRQPRCNGSEGRMSLELASAIILSSYRDRPVTLPLDRTAYSALLAELRHDDTMTR